MLIQTHVKDALIQALWEGKLRIEFILGAPLRQIQSILDHPALSDAERLQQIYAILKEHL